jgi:hypothetical protein
MLGTLSMVRGRFLIGCIAASLCVAAMAQDATYYKWTDANGTVHFSATPPPDKKAKALVLEGQEGSQTAPTPAPPTVPAEPSDELEKAQAAYRQHSCEAARNDLKLLEQNRMVVSGGSPDAATKLDAEQRNQAKLRARQRISQFCGAGSKP